MESLDCLKHKYGAVQWVDPSFWLAKQRKQKAASPLLVPGKNRYQVGIGKTPGAQEGCAADRFADRFFRRCSSCHKPLAKVAI